MRNFLARLAVVPFEMLIAFLAVISGLLGLIHVGGISQDALSLLLPDWLLTMTQALYLVAGVGMWLGVGLGKRGIESGALVLFATGIIARSVALLALAGFTAATTVSYLFNAAAVFVCAVRLRSLLRGEGVTKVDAAETVEP